MTESIVNVGQPYISTSENGKVRLNAKISCKEIWSSDKIIWYEVDERYKEGLCNDTGDAFLVLLSLFAMSRSTDENTIKIVSEAPISEKLYYNLVNWYIPTLISASDRYHMIKIECNTCKISNEKAVCVGTGVSGGVDSTYTVLKHSGECFDSNFKLTHGLYLDWRDHSDPNQLRNVDIEVKLAKKICKLHDIEFMQISSNAVIEIYRLAHDAVITIAFASYVFALQNMFGKYYVSSGYSFKEFKFKAYSIPSFDLFTSKYCSTERLELFSTGGECTRLEKVKFVSEHPITKQYLTVCGYQDENGKQCSRCSKCTRTMAELYSINKLDDYDQLFDVEAFRKHPSYYWGYIIMKRNHDVFCEEVIREMKKNNKRIPLVAWPAAFIKWAKMGFKTDNPFAKGYRP